MTETERKTAAAEAPEPSAEWVNHALAFHTTGALAMPTVLDTDIIRWFFALDREEQQRVNDLLRAYMRDHPAPTG